jgi:hypothetical protein
MNEPVTPNPIPPAPKPQFEEATVITPEVTPVHKARTMDFPTAIREVINGKKIRRESWPDIRDYCELKNGWLLILRGDKFFTWSINDGDLEGQDWVIIL